jgi:hypothetical protein
MASATENPRPSKLWKDLSEDRRLAAATAFWSDAQATAEQAEVLGTIARQINFRPKSAMALPLERKARLLARSGQVSDLVAARLLVSYHLAHQRTMMTAFLDALALPHEEGLLNDDVTPPPREAVIDAGRKLYQTFDAADVRLYFSTLLLQDPDTWGALQEVLDDAGA